HRRCARQDAARQDEGDRAGDRPDPDAARQRLRSRRGHAAGAGVKWRGDRSLLWILSMKVARAAALVLAFATSAYAQPAAMMPNPIPPSFALLSLVGDQFSVVMRREEIGSNIDPNTRRTY